MPWVRVTVLVEDEGGRFGADCIEVQTPAGDDLGRRLHDAYYCAFHAMNRRGPARSGAIAQPLHDQQRGKP